MSPSIQFETVCTGTDPQTCLTTMPGYLLGDLLFLLATIIFLLTLTTCGLIFNTFISRR